MPFIYFCAVCTFLRMSPCHIYESLMLLELMHVQIAIPFVTAFGDLFGTTALTICFALVRRDDRMYKKASYSCPLLFTALATW